MLIFFAAHFYQLEHFVLFLNSIHSFLFSVGRSFFFAFLSGNGIFRFLIYVPRLCVSLFIALCNNKKPAMIKTCKVAHFITICRCQMDLCAILMVICWNRGCRCAFECFDMHGPYLLLNKWVAGNFKNIVLIFFINFFFE